MMKLFKGIYIAMLKTFLYFVLIIVEVEHCNLEHFHSLQRREFLQYIVILKETSTSDEHTNLPRPIKPFFIFFYMSQKWFFRKKCDSGTNKR